MVGRNLKPKNTENPTNSIDFELWSSPVCAHPWFSAVLVLGGGHRDFIKDLGKGLAI